MQVADVCFNGAAGTLEGGLLQGSYCHCSDSVVCAQSVRHTSGPKHPQQGIPIKGCLPCTVIPLKIVTGWQPISDSWCSALPLLACKPGGCYWYIHQRLPIKILMEFLNRGPLKGKKFQFMGGVVGLSLYQAPSGIGDGSISPIITSLVGHRP